MEITESLLVSAAPEQVWALISDPRNAPRFNPMVERVFGLSPEKIGVGTQWKAEAQMAGRMEIANEIIEWSPPHRLAIAMDGPASGVLTFTLSSNGPNTTQVEQKATSKLPAVAAPLIQPLLERNLKESLRQIKAQVEGS